MSSLRLKLRGWDYEQNFKEGRIYDEFNFVQHRETRIDARMFLLVKAILNPGPP